MPRLADVDPLTPPERRLLAILTVAIGVTRFLALQQSPWDWDEGLFTAGVIEFDPYRHWPHPPGYPLFIAAAKLFYLIGVPPFRALQLVVLAGAFVVFPAFVAFARAIGFRFRTSLCAAALFAFLPNVWIYSGTGFSDIPAIALALLASAYLLRGRHSNRHYLIGTAILAISLGIRPQNILIALLPGIVATWSRLRASWKSVVLAALIGVVIVGATYTGAALASSSIENYKYSLEVQRDWVRNVDSWLNPARPPLVKLVRTFFIRPIDANVVMIPLLLFGLVSLIFAAIKRDARIWLAAATFIPVAIFSWLNLDISTAGRYAIAYMPLYALLAVDGIERVSRGSERVALALTLLVIGMNAVWIAPALRTQLTTRTPPAAAIEWIRSRVPKGGTVIVHAGLRPFADAFLQDYNAVVIDTRDALPPTPLTHEIYYVTDEPPAIDDVAGFRRERGRLWRVVRRRNFEASITVVTNRIRFGDGWHAEESNDDMTWRWMSGSGVIFLPAVPGRGKLSLRCFVPNDSLPSPPTVTVEVNGQTIDRFVATGESFDKSWVIDSRRAGENEVRVTTSAAVNPRKLRGVDDDRDLGLRLDSFRWVPSR